MQSHHSLAQPSKLSVSNKQTESQYNYEYSMIDSPLMNAVADNLDPVHMVGLRQRTRC